MVKLFMLPVRLILWLTLKIIDTELILADLDTVEKACNRIMRAAKGG